MTFSRPSPLLRLENKVFQSDTVFASEHKGIGTEGTAAAQGEPSNHQKENLSCGFGSEGSRNGTLRPLEELIPDSESLCSVATTKRWGAENHTPEELRRGAVSDRSTNNQKVPHHHNVVSIGSYAFCQRGPVSEPLIPALRS